VLSSSDPHLPTTVRAKLHPAEARHLTSIPHWPASNRLHVIRRSAATWNLSVDGLHLQTESGYARHHSPCQITLRCEHNAYGHTGLSLHQCRAPNTFSFPGPVHALQRLPSQVLFVMVRLPRSPIAESYHAKGIRSWAKGCQS